MAQTDASNFPLEFLKKKPDSQKINPYFSLVIKKLSYKLVIPIENTTNHERSHPLAKISHAPRHNIEIFFDKIEESVQGHFCAA